MLKYLTKNGIVDISELDEEQQVQFFLDNPDAEEITDEDARIRGYSRPNSEIEEEIDGVNHELDKEESERFSDLKWGTLSAKSNTRSGGGVAKNVSKEDFEDPNDWYSYQVWNGDIKEEIPLSDQVSKKVRSYDLDMHYKTTHAYYNQDNNNDFVSEFYNPRHLADAGVNIKDFQGWLNKHGHSESFSEMMKDGSFEDSSAASFGDYSNQLDIAQERQLSRYLKAYLMDVNDKANLQMFVDDYNKDSFKYKDNKNVNDAYNAWLKENDGGYSTLTKEEYKNYEKYNDTYFKNKIERDKENAKKRQEYLKTREKDNYGEDGDIIYEGKALGEFVTEGLEALFVDAPTETAAAIGDWLGFDGYANEVRFLQQEEKLADPSQQMSYMMTMGKSLEVNGVKYILDKYDDNLYNVTAGVNVSDTMDGNTKQNLIKKIKAEGIEDTDYNLRGASAIMGHTIGNIIFQIAGTKGAGSVRSLASLKSLQGLNKIRALRGLKPISTRARSGATGRFKSTKETFGINTPFDARYIDATSFQSFYGATIGNENTMKAALEAGIPYSEAQQLATTSSAQMALLYALTGPINPRLPMLNKIDDWVMGNNVINNSIKAYKEGGKEAARKSISNQLKRLIPDYNTLSVFMQEGFRETIQENVQQLGEMKAVNYNINQRYGEEFMKQDYDLKDFVQTSILSFAAGGLVGGVSTANFATPDSKKARITNMVLLSKNLKDTKKKLDFAVKREKLTREQSEELYNQVKAVGSAKVPAWMFNTPDELVKHAVVQQDIRKLKNDLKKFDKSTHGRLNNEIEQREDDLKEIVERAAEQSIKEDINLFKDTFKLEPIVLNNLKEIQEAGFELEMFTDGWLESDGQIYINMQQAVENQAVSVATHELLHKIIKSEFKKNPNIGKVVEEFKNILKEKGVLKKLNERARIYRAIGSEIDEGGKDQDEWLTMFSDALFKNEITFNELQESEWLRIGRSLIDIIKKKFGWSNKKYEFESGRQVYDFILNYKKNIEKGKMSNKAQRMLDEFKPDEKEGRKRSYNMEEKINQEKLNALVDPKEEWVESKAHAVAKVLIDSGAFDGLIGSKIASGKIYGRSREEILEDTKDLLIQHLNNFDPKKNNDLFGYLNSYVGFKVGTVTGRAKKAIPTTGMDVKVGGEVITRDIQDTGLNPEEIMILNEESAAAEKIASRIKIGKKISPDNKTNIKKLLFPIIRDLNTKLNEDKSINAKNSPIMVELKNRLGESLVYDVMIDELGKLTFVRNSDGKKVIDLNSGLVKKLLELKQDVLKNGTTTWLMGKDMGSKVNGGIPQVIDKVIKLEDGTKTRVSYPNWVGKEVAREGMNTFSSGRTSGHDLVFRSDNAVELDNDTYLSQFIQDGKLIRNRKEALAKHLAQEVGIELLIDELINNKEGALAEEFNKNQLAKGVVNAVKKINLFLEQAERGGIKRSVSRAVAIELYQNAVELGAKEGDDAALEYLNSLPNDYKFIKGIYEKDLDVAATGFIAQLKQHAETKVGKKAKPYLDKFLSMSSDEKKKAIVPFSKKLASILPGQLYSEFGAASKTLLGLHKRVIDPNGEAGKAITEIINNPKKYGSVPFTGVKIIQASSGFVLQIQNQILGKNFKTKKEAEEKFEEIFGEDIKNINNNNLAALVYILEQAQRVVAANPKLIPGYLTWLQSNGSIGKALRGLTGIQEVQIHAENQAPFVGKINEDGTRKGYWGLKKNDGSREMYDNGEIIINRWHPDYKEAKKYIDNRLANSNKIYNDPKTSKVDKDKAKNYIDKTTEEQYRERLRPKGEHKNPSSNTFGKIAIIQLGIINTILENPGSEIISLASTQSLIDAVSDFSQSIGTEVWSKIQDDIHGPTSSKGDLRALTIPENKLKYFYPVKGQIQALGRAARAVNIKIEEFAKTMSAQKVLDRSRSISIKPKGISVYDFDDTLAFSSSKIIVTMPNGKIKEITPSQFAKQHTTLEASGAKFNYSEFDKVVKGKPGPLAPRLKKAIGKFGNDNIFVLTARPQASAKAIYKFLKGIGLEIPIENIVGLENGTPAAKAGWVVNKVAEGYNDFYFVDDAYKNVKAVQNVLNVFDVKGKVQQANINRKRSLSGDLNNMVERNTNVKAAATFSKVVARKKGAGKGKYKFFVPHGAEDFRGLTSYTLAGKGKQGEADQKFFEDNLVTPYSRGVGSMEAARQALKNDYRGLLRTFPDIKKKLNKIIEGTDFTYDQALRVYLYSQSGHEIPGISKRDRAALLNVVNGDPDLKTFANTLQVITKKTEWVKPEEYWDVGSILKDLNSLDQNVNRKEYLAEFIENVDTIFSEKNLNKLEAIYGTRYREALENIIRRMKTGSNKPGNMGGLEGKWLNWVNNSVGTIMFFNRRSAFLQMISFTNFVNWSDNNPLMAAAAFANQPLYWKTWVKIFNSDKLKQRRGGLKSDVQEQEIANQAKNSKDTASAIVAYLLKIGFTPTQIADSMAIATGGSTFLINRTKTYLKQGMSKADADAKAWEDFSKVSDETQQSGDPMLISSQQASHLGRLILAFQNTPMQYTRLMKKAGQDLVNGRGDYKTNLSKIMYYGFVQNLIFNALQQALFALLPEFDPDDEEFEDTLEGDIEKYMKREKIINTKKEKIINGMVDTILRGSGLAGAVVATLKNTINKYYTQEKKGYMADHTYTLLELANISPPIGSKLRKVYSAIQSHRFNKDVMQDRGFSVVADGRVNISPSYEVVGNLLSAGFNIPLDRAVVEIQSISEALDSRNTSYQRIALLLGWRNWDVNAKNEENDFIKLVYKEIKAIEAKEKRKKNKKKGPTGPRKRSK